MKILSAALAAAAAMAVMGLPAAAIAQVQDHGTPDAVPNDKMHHDDMHGHMDGHHGWHHRGHHAWHRHCWTKWHHHHRVRVCKMMRAH